MFFGLTFLFPKKGARDEHGFTDTELADSLDNTDNARA